MNLVAIDPGYAKSGQGNACAWFDGGVLSGVWFARSMAFPRAWPLPAWATVAHVVWEIPQVRPHGGGGDPVTLITLAAEGATLAGLIAGHYGATIEAQTPTIWKGTLPKPVQHWAMWRELSMAERAVLGGAATERHILAAREAGARRRWPPGVNYYPARWLDHNLLDAVALGCTALRRLVS